MRSQIWTQQPAGANRQLAPAWAKQNRALVDLGALTPNKGTLNGTVIRPSRNGLQRGFYSTLGVATTDRVDLSLPDNTWRTNSFTLLFTFRRLSAGGGGFGRLLSQATEVNLVTVSTTLNIALEWSGTDGAWTAPLPTTGKDVVCVITYDAGDGTATSAKPRVWYDGVEQAVTTGTAPTGSFVTNRTGAWSLGNRASDSARGWDGLIGLFGWWQYATPDGQSLSTNPWQIFQPIQKRTLVGVASAGDTGVFSADGTSTVDGIGAALFSGVGSSDGVGAASGVGASLAASVFSSDGVATVAGVGSYTTADNQGVAEAAGSATVSGVGAAIIQAVFGAAGSATVTGISPTESTGAGYSYETQKRKKRGKRLIVDGEFIYSDDPRLPAKLAALAEKAEKAAEPAPTQAPEASALGNAKKAVKKARRLATQGTISIPQDAPGEIDPQTYALLEAYQARVNEAFNRALVRRIEELQFLEELRDEEEVLILAALMG